MGGIPHYLKQFDDKKSLQENILKNILTRGSILYSEVDFLLRQELRETGIIYKEFSMDNHIKEQANVQRGLIILLISLKMFVRLS